MLWPGEARRFCALLHTSEVMSCELKDLLRVGAANQFRKYSFDACLPEDRSQKQAGGPHLGRW